jgi:hypothetical protein
MCKGVRLAYSASILALLLTVLSPAQQIAASNSLPYYYLPWDAGRSITVSQGNNTSFTHVCPGSECYAWDFPGDGLNVRAAREGTVTAVQDGYGVGGCDATKALYVNYVKVKSADGYETLYLHLRSGISAYVTVGQSVPTNAVVIALMGASGYTCNGQGTGPGPHLHYQVEPSCPSVIECTSVASSFLDSSVLSLRSDGVPRTGDAVVAGFVGGFTGAWYLKNTDAGGAADIAFQYGMTGQIPVVGDWTGSCVDTVGVFHSGEWDLRLSNSSGNPDIVIGYGQGGDIPVVGDWTGQINLQTGCRIDDIGVVRGNTWYLRNVTPFSYGLTTDTPIVGDWAGIGKSTAGVHRGNYWYLRNSNTSGGADITVVWGLTTDTPLTGDWAGVGQSGLGIHRSPNNWYLSNSVTQPNADVSFSYGLSSDIATVGDWTGQVGPPTYKPYDTPGVGR